MSTMQKPSEAHAKNVHKPIQTILNTIKKEIDGIDRKLEKLINSIAEWRQKRDLLLSAKGVGNVLAYILMSELPKLVTLRRKQIAALVGVTSMNRDSGVFEGKRYICGGRHKIRSVLFVSIISAIHWSE
ncbi:transposase [Aestuariicella sp. G3-2]|uniref:transposase n=1 Tax=Pseudomaricurvus albidus TaxID=2842452 RepID=UPI001C0ADF25|nr:transposase [Aestuariicella albida]MBU3068265.1 transposase [Aestuariicella albida]